MRAFLAFEMPREIIDYLRMVVDRMAPLVKGVKWVRDEGIHVTVKFFGEIEEKQVTAIHEAIAPIGAKHAPFVASLKQIDAFPDKRRARVIIVKLDKGAETMKEIAADAEERFSGLGFEREKREFTPHLTLGRRRVPEAYPGDPPIVEPREFRVKQMVLYQSTLTPGGAIYNPLWTITLGG